MVLVSSTLGENKMLLECPICNSKFECCPSRIKKAKNPPCCSRECANIQREQNNKNCTCDFCGKKFHKKPSHIEKDKHNYCSVECLAKHRKEIYQGINNPNSFCRIPIGNKKIHCGYYWVYLPQHPLATKSGYIREHRLVAEQFLLTEENYIEISGQKYLSPEFEVHHKDLNKLNNDPSNLEVLTPSEHAKKHGEIKRQALELLKNNDNK